MTQSSHDAESPTESTSTAPMPESTAPTASAKTERAARLAAALRDNLRRRKAPRPAASLKERN